MRKRATVIVVKGGKALLIKGRGQHRWSFPGGRIERGEAAAAAAARELYEEVGLRAGRVTRLHDGDYRTSLNQHKAFLVETDDEPNVLERGIDTFIWWYMKTPVPVFEHVTAILGAYRRREAIAGAQPRPLVDTREAVEVAADDMRRCRAWIGMAGGLRVADRQEPALVVLEKAEKIAVRDELTFERSRIHHLRGNVYFPLGNIDGCLAEHEQALKFARKEANAK